MRSQSEVKPPGDDTRRESGLPGGGQGRTDVVGRTGVAPGSGPYPGAGAEVRTPASFVHGQRDAQGRPVEGGSGLIDFEGMALLGGAIPGSSSPPEGTEMIPEARAAAHEQAVEIPAGTRRLKGLLAVPDASAALVVFVRGSGCGQPSPRNESLARAFQGADLATLRIDLLVEDEVGDPRRFFDIELLEDRLSIVTYWLGRDPRTRPLRLGYFGTGSGAAAALAAAARRPEAVAAIVCRGGMLDPARSDLLDVRAPTLLLVGGRDEDILELNRRALALLRCPRELAVVPGATHLFPEPGALDEVARLATRWFVRHLIGR